MKRIFARGIVLSFLAVGIPGLLQAQRENTRNLALPQGTIDKVLNNAFGSLVGATPNSGEIANYASLDLLNATFNLKGYLPLHGNEPRTQKEKRFEDSVLLREGNVSYLSFALSGNLTDKKYASLFSNSSLNAGVSGQLSYNFRLSPAKFSYSRKEWDLISFRIDELRSSYHRKMNTLDNSYSDSTNHAEQLLLSQQVLAAKARLSKLQSLASSLNTAIGPLEHADEHPELIDSLVKIDNDRRTLQTSLEKYSISLDSLANQAKNENVFIGMQHEVEEQQKFRKDYDSIISTVPLLKFSTSWFSVTGGFTEKNFYTYNPAVQYSAQIASNNLGVFNMGAAYNYFKQDKQTNRIIFFNGTVSWLRDNNLSSLTTKEIDRVKTSVNTGGDTVRTITSKYNAYTSPVVNYYAWNLTANLYYLRGRTPTGIHLLPSYNFQSNGVNIANLQVGYIFSFKSTSKGKALLNTELYVQFQDLFNQQKLQSDLWRREVIGISFALPFNTIN